MRDERLARLARTDEILKANFNSAQRRDDKGQRTAHSNAGTVVPVRSRQQSTRIDPHTLERVPNSDFRNRLAVAEGTADRPHLAIGRCLIARTSMATAISLSAVIR